MGAGTRGRGRVGGLSDGWLRRVAASGLAIALAAASVQSAPPPAAAQGGITRITGSVTDASTSSPLAGATVTLVDQANGESLAARTDADGTYSMLSNLPASGTLYMIVTAPGYLGDFVRPSLTAGSDAVSFTLTPNPVATVSGSVTDASTGSPVAGASVAIYSDQSGQSLSATAAGDGTYTLAYPLPIIPTAYHALVSAPGHLSKWLPLALSAGSVSLSTSLAPTPAAHVSGAITDASTGGPVAGATVEIFADASGQSVSATTAGDGTYAVDDPLPADVDQVSLTGYHALVTAPGYVGAWLQVTLASGRVAFSTQLTPDPAAALTGTVTDASTGDPVAGAAVTVLSPYTGETLGSTTTDASGNYSLPYHLYPEALAASPDPYMILVTAAGYVGAWQDAPSAPGAAALPIALSALPASAAALGTVSGTVESYQGQPIGGATVIFVNATQSGRGSQVFGAVTTGSDGSWSFPYLQGVDDAGALDALAVIPGLGEVCDGDCGGHLAWSGQSRSNVLLQAGQYPAYGGQTDTATLGSGGPPAAGATVLLLSRPQSALGPQVFGVTTADATGAFSFTFPQPQPGATGQSLDALALDQPYGYGCDGDCGGHFGLQGAAAPVVLPAQPDAGTASGTATQGGIPVPGATVLLLSRTQNGLGPTVYGMTTTDASGNYGFAIAQPNVTGEDLDALAYDPPYGSGCDGDCGGHFSLSGTNAIAMPTTVEAGQSYGQVLLPSGKPAAGATVVLYDHFSTPWRVYGVTTTDGNGVYSFPDEMRTSPGGPFADTWAYLPGYGSGCFGDCGGHFFDQVWPQPGQPGAPAPVTLGGASTPVVPLNPLSGSGERFSAPAGSAFSGTVCTFSDVDGNTDPSAYSASVDWGDGTTTAGTVSAAAGGGFAVSASHTYATAGDFAVTVAVTDTDGAAVTLQGVANPPAIASLDPASGPATGGTTVTITGMNLQGVTQVDFGPDNPATDVSVVSPTELTVKSAPGADVAGVTVTDAVTSSTPSATSQFAYQPVVTSVSPDSGGPAGGNRVTVTGAGFLGATAVTFGAGGAGTGLSVESSAELTVTTPPGIGAVDVEVATPGGTSAPTAADQFTYFPALFTSDSHAVDANGIALAAWPHVLPQPGVGIDTGLPAPFVFGGVDFTLQYGQGEHVLLSQDGAGTQPICVEGSWQLSLTGPVSATLAGSGTASGSTCTPSSSSVPDLASLNLPSGTYGAELTLTAPASGDTYGTSDVYLIVPAGDPQPTGFAVVPGTGIAQAARVGGSATLTVGQSGSLAVTAASTPLPVAGVHAVYAYDPSGVSVTGVIVESGWRIGGWNDAASGNGGHELYGPSIDAGGTLFGLQVTCHEAGTFPISFSGVAWAVTYGGAVDMTLSGAPAVTCTAPPASATASVTGVAIDPADGSVSATIAASGMAHAASAELLRPGGSAVASTTHLTVDPGGSLVTASFGAVAPGLYDMTVLGGGGNTLATTTGAPLEVSPALPLFSFGPADTLGDIPGIPTAHVWNVSNVGTVDATAVMLFTFPAYMTTEPALTDAPPGVRLLEHGLTAKGWAEYVAAPVGVGGSVDLAFTVTVPPAAVNGSSPALAFDEPVPMVASLVGQLTAPEWTAVSGESAGQILAASVGDGAGDFTAALSSVVGLGQGAADTYVQDLPDAYMAQALENAAQSILDDAAAAAVAASAAPAQLPPPSIPSGEEPTPPPSAQGALPADALGDPIASSYAVFSLDTGEALADGYTAHTLDSVSQAAANGQSLTGAAVVGAGGTPVSSEAYVPGASVPYLEGSLEPVLGVPLGGASNANPPSLGVDATWQAGESGVDVAPWASAITSGITLAVVGTPTAFAALPYFDPPPSGQGQAPGADTWQNINSNNQSIPRSMHQFDPVYSHGSALHNLIKATGNGSSVSTTAVVADVAGTALAAYVCAKSSSVLACGVAIGILAVLIGGTFVALYYMHKAVHAVDPNDIEASPAGAGSGGWITPQPITYVIHFQNDPAATAPAVNIRVTATLDPGLDPSTLQIGDPDQSSYSGTQVQYDPTTRQITWWLPGIDLPPDTSPPSGEGWVSFTATPLGGLASGTTISESAQVVFNYNPPVDTASVTQTLDTQPPLVTMAAMPQAESAGSVTLSWSTQGGAPIQAYDLYESQGSGPLVPVLSTPDAAASVTVAPGESYGFAVQATDLAGLASPVPTAAQVSFSVPSPSQAATPSGAPAPPQGLSATALSTTAVALAWQASAGATAYRVLRASSPAGPFAPVASAVATSYTDRGLQPGAAYAYEVEAVDADGTSGASTPVVVHTPAALGSDSVTLVVGRARVPAGGREPVPLAVSVATAAGGPAAGDTITFSLTGACGTVRPASVKSDAAGRAGARYLPGRRAGTCTIMAREAHTGAVSLASIEQEALTLSLALSPPALVANGTSRAVVVATVKTVSGAPLMGDRVRFELAPTPACGRLLQGAATTGRRGRAHARYQSGRNAGGCVVTAREAQTGLVARATLRELATARHRG